MTGPVRDGASPPDLLAAAALRLEAHALRRYARSAEIVCTGVGPLRARRAAASLRARPGHALAVAGVSGALAPGVAPGDVVVVSALCELKPGGPGWRELESAPALVAILARRGLEPVLGRLVTADHIVCGRERSALRETGADIVDMESAALAQGAAGRPFAVVRVVLDTPAQGFASPSFLLDGFRALRKLGTVLPALEDWAAGCAHRAAAEPRPPIRRSR